MLRGSGLPKSAKGAHYPEMTVHRTTKASIGAQSFQRMAGLCLLLIVALCAPLQARADLVDDDLRLRLVSASPTAPQWPPDLLIEGNWPTSCLPVVVRTSLENDHIDVLLRNSGSRCAANVTPLSLKVNPAREAGLRQLALGIFQVRLYLLGTDGASELLAFRLLRSGGDDTSSRPESGFWWSVSTASFAPALAGSGLSIEQQGENLAVTLLSYQAGAPVWYFGSARMPGNIVRIPLVRMVGGDEPFNGANAGPGAEPGMSINLQFLSPAHAGAWLVRPRPGLAQGIEAQELNLLRLPFETDRNGASWKGQWALVADQAVDARLYDLAELVTADAESFQLRDASGAVSLHCRLETIGGHPVPAFCTLSKGTAILADFDRIGLDRLSGLTTDGRSVRLVRVPD